MSTYEEIASLGRRKDHSRGFQLIEGLLARPRVMSPSRMTIGERP